MRHQQHGWPIGRRQLLGGLIGLLGAATSGISFADHRRPASSKSSALVVLWTRTGNTRVVADLVHRECATDWFEITPREAYPADYETTVAQVSAELERDYRPPLAGGVADITRYDTIYLAFPIWSSTMPPPVRSFLAAHPLGAQTLVPLITHGGFGTGDALDVLAELEPRARIQSPFVMEGEQERRVMNRVRDWMNQSSAARSS